MTRRRTRPAATWTCRECPAVGIASTVGEAGAAFRAHWTELHYEPSPAPLPGGPARPPRPRPVTVARDGFLAERAMMKDRRKDDPS